VIDKHWGGTFARNYARGLVAGAKEADRVFARYRTSDAFRQLPADLQRRVGLIHWRIRQMTARDTRSTRA
jgi:hypothetical protein